MKCVLFIGQSLGATMFAVNYHNPTPLAGTFMWTASGWAAPTGDGAREYANRIKAATGEDVYLINACVNGLPLLPVSGGASWTTTGAGSAAATAIAATQAALASVSGLDLDRVEFMGCQSDAMALAYPDMYASITAGLTTLLGLLRAGLGNGFRLAVWPVGKVASGSICHLNRAISVWSNQPVMGVEHGPASHDFAYSDGTHWQDSQYLLGGIRGSVNANSYFAAKAAGTHNVNHFGAGPKVSKIVRLNNMALVYVDTKPGTWIQARNPWSDSSDVTNLKLFWGINACDELGVVYCRMDGGLIRIASPTVLSYSVSIGHAQERDWGGLDVYDSNGQVLLPLTQGKVAGGVITPGTVVSA